MQKGDGKGGVPTLDRACDGLEMRRAERVDGDDEVLDPRGLAQSDEDVVKRRLGGVV